MPILSDNYLAALDQIDHWVAEFEITPPTCDGLLVEIGMPPSEARRTTDRLFANRAESF